MIKKSLFALGFLGLAGLFGLVFLERALLSALQEKGVTFEQMERGLFNRQFYGLQFQGLKAERVTTSLLAPKTIYVAGLQVPIQPEASADQLGVEGPSVLPQDIHAHLSQVGFFWGENLLVDGLSGEMVDGRIVLDGPSLHLSSGGISLQADWDGPLPLSVISGEASLHLKRGGRIVLEIELPQFTLEHPLLHARPVQLKNAILHLEGDRLGRRLHGTLSVDNVNLQVHIERENKSFAVDVVLAPTALSQTLSPLAHVLPELKKAEIEGQVSAQLQFQWPAMTWDGDFHLENVEVHGAVPQVYALRKGTIQHRVQDIEGDAILRETGEGSANWIALKDIAAPMRHAVIAAEDIRFTQHPGFDMEALREAFNANREAGAVLRGGSSLSQQLAKNLYLDGQRTLVRKIRELLSTGQVSTHQKLLTELPEGVLDLMAIPGIGPKIGLKLIREHGTLEAVAEARDFEVPERLDEIRSLFLEHPTTPDALPHSTHAVEEDLRAFLQDERGFSEGRVQRALDRLTGVAKLRSSSQPTLFDF
jgi:hypothetical protein